MKPSARAERYEAGGSASWGTNPTTRRYARHRCKHTIHECCGNHATGQFLTWPHGQSERQSDLHNTQSYRGDSKEVSYVGRAARIL
jgi:hypothetical protein